MGHPVGGVGRRGCRAPWRPAPDIVPGPLYRAGGPIAPPHCPQSVFGLVLAEEAAADDGLLDLAGALADEQERRLTHEPLDLVLLGVAVAAVDAEGLGGHLGAVLAGDQLGHAGLDV